MSEDTDDFLAHHGIKGMHWGRHKPGTVSAGSARRATYLNTLSDAKAARKNKVKLTSDQADAVQTHEFRKAAVLGGAVALAGAAWIAKQRYDNNADTRLFNKNAPAFRRKFSAVLISAIKH